MLATYAKQIYMEHRAPGAPPESDLTYGLCTVTLFTLGNLLTALLVDRVGRRLAHAHARPVVPALARVAPHHKLRCLGGVVARAVEREFSCVRPVTVSATLACHGSRGLAISRRSDQR